MQTAIKDPLTQEPVPLIYEAGEPRAVILDLDRFRFLSACAAMLDEDDESESRLLAESPAFRSLMAETMGEVSAGKTQPWREALDEL